MNAPIQAAMQTIASPCGRGPIRKHLAERERSRRGAASRRATPHQDCAAGARDAPVAAVANGSRAWLAVVRPDLAPTLRHLSAGPCGRGLSAPK